MTIELTGHELTIDELVSCARQMEPVSIAPEAKERVRESRARLKQAIEESEAPIYGVNTGFGDLANKQIGDEEVDQLQENLIVSHAVGTGDPASREEVRATMLLRLNSLLIGKSGIRLTVVEILRDCLNENVYPYIPRKGSVTASGDLAPLAHMTLVLMGRGLVERDGEWVPVDGELADGRIDPVTLTSKEGLALINGTNFATGIAALGLYDARHLADIADVAGALTLEASRGVSDPFSAEIHRARPHETQATVASHVRELVDGSDLVEPAQESDTVQNQYSLRCIPQVHGAARDLLEYCHRVIETEMNAATDNPLVLDSGRVVSGGNFHGQYVGFALDILSMALSELSSISERRTASLLQLDSSEIEPFLASKDSPGLNSGFMILQVTAAALVSENKTLSTPSSTDSIPTSAGQEDHVSMAANSGNQLVDVISNLRTVLSIELFAAYQALSFRSDQPGDSTAAVVEVLSEFVTPVARDREIRKDLETIERLVDDGRIFEAVTMFDERGR